LVEILGRQADLTDRHCLPLQAVSNSAAMDPVSRGKLVHGLAGLVLLDDLGSFGGGETALDLTRRTR
jgi:hypothetical protein